MIDMKTSREAYNNGIIDVIIWFHRKFNIADAMKKPTTLRELCSTIIWWQATAWTTTIYQYNENYCWKEKKKKEGVNDDICTKE